MAGVMFDMSWIDDPIFNKSALARKLGISPQLWKAKKTGTLYKDKKGANGNCFSYPELLKLEEVRKEIVEMLTKKVERPQKSLYIAFK